MNMSRKTGYWAERAWRGLVWSLAALVIQAAAPAVAGDAGARDATAKNGDAAKASEVTEQLPLPPTLDGQQLQAHQGPAAAKAQLPLARIVTTVERPAFLDADPEAVVWREPPLSAAKSFMSGRQAFLEGRNREAIEDLQEALSQAPGRPEILQALGEIYLAWGNRTRGAVYLEEAAAAGADPLTLFKLGQIAVEQGQWSRGIAIFDHLLKLDAQQMDPGVTHLSHFYLGLALQYEGYDAAGLEQLTAFLSQPQRLGRTTGMGRDLARAYSNIGLTWQSVGDALLRLDQPAEALQAYETALKTGFFGRHPSGLVARQCYALLRLNRPKQAQTLVLDAIAAGPADADLMGLVQYVARQARGAGPLADHLLKMYQQQGRPASLARVLADLLPPADAIKVLSAHLEQDPKDYDAFEQMLRLAGQVDPENPDARRIATTVDAVKANPESAGRFADLLMSVSEDRVGLLKAFDTLPAKTRSTAAALLLKGIVHLGVGEAEAATEMFERAVAEKPDFIAGRLALARMLIHQKAFAEAATVLEPLPRGQDSEIDLLRVQLLAATDRADEALALLDAMIGRQSDDVQLVLAKANLQLAAQNDAVAAERTLLDALNRTPTAEPIYEALLRMYDAALVPASHRQYQHLVRRMFGTIPESRIARLERAKLVITQNPELAQRLLEGLLAENPRDHKALFELLTMHWRAGRRDQASGLIQQQLAATPRDQTLLLVLREFYERVDAKAEVAAMEERLILLEPDSPERTMRLALHYLRLPEPRSQEAIALLKPALEKPSENPEFLVALLGRATLQSNQPLETVQPQVDKALERFPKRAGQIRLAWAGTLMEGEDPEAAATTLEAALEGEPEEPVAILRTLGQAYAKLDRGAELAARIDAAVKRWPEHEADLWFTLGMHLNDLGRFAESEQIMGKVVERYADHHMAANFLGYTMANRGEQLKRARALIERAVGADPDNAAYLDSMGWVAYKQGQFDEALTWLKRARDAGGGTHPVILDHLGDAYYRVGQRDAAVRAWSDAHRVFNAMQELDSDAVAEPDMVGMEGRLTSKIKAVRMQQAAPVADSAGNAPPPPAVPEREHADGQAAEDDLPLD